MTVGLPSVNEIIPGQIYLGNLSAARSQDTLKKLGVTHIVSVCPEYPSTGPKHLTIPIEDTEYDNILIQLPTACEFIEAALKSQGKVLVHCVMGISRSTTVIAAYLMKTRKMSRSAAIKFIKKRRPEVHPNYGFIKQLEAFAECQYEPSLTHPMYLRWKRCQEQNVTQFINQLVDTTVIIPNKLLLSSEFPDDVCQAESLILDAGITHILSVSPTHIPPPALACLKQHRDIELTKSKGDLLLSLPDACMFIQDAIKNDGQVLVHSRVETTACIVACAYLMYSLKLSNKEAFSRIHDALPLFNPTKSFSRHLELFEECRYSPTLENPVVWEWVNAETSPTPTPQSGIPHNLCDIAAQVMSETSFDVGAFESALAAIQKKPVVVK